MLAFVMGFPLSESTTADRCAAHLFQRRRPAELEGSTTPIPSGRDRCPPVATFSVSVPLLPEHGWQALNLEHESVAATGRAYVATGRACISPPRLRGTSCSIAPGRTSGMPPASSLRWRGRV